MAACWAARAALSSPRSRTGRCATSSAIRTRAESDGGSCIPSVHGAPGDLEAPGILVPFILGVWTSVQHPSPATAALPWWPTSTPGHCPSLGATRTMGGQPMKFGSGHADHRPTTGPGSTLFG